MERHGCGVAERQDETCAGSLCRADRAEDVGRARALIVRRRWPRPAACPAAGDLVLLPDPGFMLACGFVLRDLRQPRREAFLKVATASASWAWWRGRADSLRKPIARNSRLSVCVLIETRNSSWSHCIRSISRQRTTPCTAGSGPLSMICANSRRRSSVRIAALPGGLPFTRPAGPSALNRRTQSRSV